MTTFPYRPALIIGAGAGIGAAVARRLAAAGCPVGLVARDAWSLVELRPWVETF